MYRNNKKAWMTRKIFYEWLNTLNEEMVKQDRKILLLLDNASVHVITKKMSNLELYYLPIKTTSKIQPLDQGVISVFKSYYKKFFMRNLTLYELSVDSSYCENVRCFKLYDSLHIIFEAWREVTGITVANCFRKAIDNWEYAYMTNSGIQFEDEFSTLAGEKTSYDEYENYQLYDDSFVDDQDFYE